MKIVCDICAKKLKEPGALIFTPPHCPCEVYKYHVCVDCYNNKVHKLIFGDRK